MYSKIYKKIKNIKKIYKVDLCAVNIIYKHKIRIDFIAET